ncbi:MAG TPA: phosphatase PAP2 family protein [Actinomycetota bacterium]|nr:phosphatase PAP2 family protein [Actinomycetota bacterium]
MGRRPGLFGIVVRLGAAAALGCATKDKRVADLDVQACGLVAARRSKDLDRAMPVLTDLGSTYAVGGAAAALWMLGRKELARDVFGAGITAWLVAQGAKQIYKRVRPYDDQVSQLMVRRPAGTSYPSGHPAVAAAIERILEPAVVGPARALIGRTPRFVALSRVYVGAHYPTDVVGGLLLGGAIGDLWRRYSTDR